LLHVVAGLKLFSPKIVVLFYVKERKSSAGMSVPVDFYKHKRATITDNFICIRL